jgi:eukaryotic-like serine/threonine-protein kinase
LVATHAQKEDAPMIGKVLDGKYEIVGRLGAGAMGEVHEGKHVGTGRRVAIKIILGMLAQDDALVARFQREARAAGVIDSRHITQVLDAGKEAESGAPYLVMELLVGEDLDTLMKRLGALRPTLALRIVAQALAGIERAHAANVVHRDLKPANLFVARSDGGQRIVKIVDFGIAKVKDNLQASRDAALTQTSALLGSPLYMSPEQAKASKTVDGRADLWSLGVVLYQALTGAAPHAKAESLTELLLAICTETATRVQEAAPWVPPEVAAIADRAMKLDLNARYANASEMLAAIAAIVPDWQRLDESLITPMTEEERTFVAIRAASLLPAQPVGVSTGPSPGAATATDAPTGTLVSSSSSSSSAALAASQTTGGTSSSATRDVGPNRSRVRIPLIVGGVAVLAVLGVVGAKALAIGPYDSDRGDPGARASAGLVATPAAPTSSVATASAPAPSPSPSAEPVAPAVSTAAATSAASTPPVTAAAKTAPVAVPGKPSAVVAAPTTTTTTKPAAPATTNTKPAGPATTSSSISREFN